MNSQGLRHTLLRRTRIPIPPLPRDSLLFDLGNHAISASVSSGEAEADALFTVLTNTCGKFHNKIAKDKSISVRWEPVNNIERQNLRSGILPGILKGKVVV